MRALQVTEFDELMAHKAGVAIGDGEVTLAFFHRDAGRASGCFSAESIHKAGCVEAGSVVECGFTIRKLSDGAADDQDCAQCFRLPGQMQCNNRRVGNCVFNHQQPACQACAEVGLERGEFAAGKHLAGDATRGEPSMFPLSLGHLLFVCCYPQCSWRFVLRGRRKRDAQLLP